MPPKPEPGDVQLSEQIKKGNLHAFDMLFQRYSQQLYRYSKSLLKNHEDAEEIVQEVFFRIWIKRDELNKNTSIKSFMFCISRNLIIDQFRQKTSNQKYLQHLIKQAQKNYLNPAEELEYRDLERQLESIISDMPERRKQIYRMSRNKGLSNNEIAMSLRLKPKTVENQITLAIRIIRDRLKS